MSRQPTRTTRQITSVVSLTLLALLAGCSNGTDSTAHPADVSVSGAGMPNASSNSAAGGATLSGISSVIGGAAQATASSNASTLGGSASASSSATIGGTAFGQGGIVQTATYQSAAAGTGNKPTTTVNGGSSTTNTGGATTKGGSSATNTSSATTKGGSSATNAGGVANKGGSAATPGGTTAASPGSAGTTSGKGLTLYYIRHAEVVANTLDPAQITYENSETLTDFGLQQITELTTYLKDMNVSPDAVLVSPTKRTQQTIGPYLADKAKQGEVWMELAECCTQSPTGAALPTAPTYSPYPKATIEVSNLSFRDPAATKYWQTDTFEAGLFMVITAKNEILSRYGQSGKTIFVVGHASAGQLMIGLLRGGDMTQGAPTTGTNAVYLLNTGVMRLVQDPTTGVFKLDGRNINNPKTQ